MEDRKVKVTLLIDYIRMIRANSDKDWNKYLKPEDWEVVNGRILPSVLYPFGTFQRCGMATFYLIAEKDLNLVKLFGRVSGEQMFKNVYRTVEQAPDPVSALERFIMIRNQLDNFEMFKLELEKVDEKHIKLHSNSFDPKEWGAEQFTWQMMGVFERLIELTGGKNPKIDIISKEWEGAPETISDWTWE